MNTQGKFSALLLSLRQNCNEQKQKIQGELYGHSIKTPSDLAHIEELKLEYKNLVGKEKRASEFHIKNGHCPLCFVNDELKNMLNVNNTYCSYCKKTFE